MFTSTLYDWLRVPASDVLVDACVKASLLLAVTVVAAVLLRHKSAAVRHRLWCLGFCGVLALPIFSLTLPQWRLPLLPAPEVALATSDREQEADPLAEQLPASDLGSGPRVVNEAAQFVSNDLAPQGFADVVRGAAVADPIEESLSATQQSAFPVSANRTHATARNWVIDIWLTGVVIVLLPFWLGLVANWWTLRSSKRVRTSHWTRLASELAAKLGLARHVTLLETRQAVVPMTWGVLRPVVLLPSESNGWNDARRRVVLLHELAHVKRLDVLFQLIARLACALYWFNPLAWYALWRLRVERELACDDCVVATGERPTDYASQLVQIARAYRPVRFSVGVAMARSTKLEHRIVALLDQARSHLPVGKQFARVLLAGSCVLVLGLSVVGLGERSSTSAETRSEDTAARGVEAGMAHGRVVNESGKPIANAHVYTILSSKERYTWETRHRIVSETKADRDGHFEIDLQPYDAVTFGERYLITHSLSLLAVAEGFGPDAYHGVDKAPAGDEITLTLAQDTIPLKGRVLDLEGRPVAGVRVQVRSIQTTESNVDAWIAKASNNPSSIPDDSMMQSQVRQQVAHFPTAKTLDVEGLSLFPPVVTDGQGRFQLSGLGPDRLVALELEGPNLAKDRISAVTRTMPPVPLPTADPRSRTERCFGASFDYSAEPTQVITGVLRDLDSEKPIVGATVQVHQFANSLLGVNGFVSATTDQSGRYQLVGIPKPADGARPIKLEVLPGPDQPYFRTDVTLSERVDGLRPVKFDIELKRAAWVSGRLIDQPSGESVAGYVSYYPFIENTVAVDYSNFGAERTSIGHDNWYRTAPDGSYRIPAIRGRGVVVARAFAAPDYAIGAGAEQIGWESNPQDKLIYHLYGPELTNTVREVIIEADEATNQDVALTLLTRQRIRLLDPNGQPLIGVRVGCRWPGSALNETDVFRLANPEKGPSVEAIGLHADGQRLMLFSHTDGKLGKAIVVDKATDAVMLEPLATFSGRLIDATGTPVEGQYVKVAIPKSESPESNDKRAWGRRDQSLAGGRSDSEGRFHFDNVLPGMKCVIEVNKKTLASRDVVEPGDVVDFGDLQLASNDEEPDAANLSSTSTADVAEIATSQGAKLRFSISVLDPQGKPIAGATIYAREPFFEEWKVVATADDSGTAKGTIDADLDLTLDESQAKGIRFAVVAAGFGFNWFDTTGAELGEKNFTVQLKPDVPIEGRIVSADGQPLPEVEIVLGATCQPTDRSLDDYIEVARREAGSFRRWRDNWWSGNLPGQAPIRTEADGRFRIVGIGAERMVEMRTVGEGCHDWTFYVATRRPPADFTNEAGAIRVSEPPYWTHYYTKFTHVSPPNRTLTGTVRDEESGAPLSNIRIGDDMSTMDRVSTDENGRFRLRGLLKKDRYTIQVSALGSNYLNRWIDIPDEPGVAPMDVDIEMMRGIMVRGKVMDKSTGEPAQGKVEYYPLFPNNYVNRLGGASAYGTTFSDIAEDGSYEMPVLPGPGALAVRNYDSKYAIATIDTAHVEEILGAAIEGNSANSLMTALGGQGMGMIGPLGYKAIALIKPNENTKELAQDIFLSRGRVLEGTIMGPNGEAVQNVQAFGLSDPTSSHTVAEGIFRIEKITATEERTLIFFHRKKNLGAIASVKADHQGDLRIRLQPCGSARGRLVDEDGDPIKDTPVTFYRPESSPFLNGGDDTWKTRTDDDGRFKIDALVAGVDYSGILSVPRPVAFGVKVASAQERDLGELTVPIGGER